MSVLQKWVEALPLKMQSCLVLGLRGCDTPTMHETKKIIKWLRGVTFKPAEFGNLEVFMQSSHDVPAIYEKGLVNRELDVAPHHFYTHLMHSLEIVGYMHPDETILVMACTRYEGMCNLMHLPIEHKDDFCYRLRDYDWPGGIQPDTFEEAIALVKTRSVHTPYGLHSFVEDSSNNIDELAAKLMSTARENWPTGIKTTEAQLKNIPINELFTADVVSTELRIVKNRHGLRGVTDTDASGNSNEFMDMLENAAGNLRVEDLDFKSGAD